MNPDLEILATEIKKLFIRAKNRKREQRSGGRYTPYKLAPRHNKKDVWLAAAQICWDMRVSPDTLIDAAFAYCTFPDGPFPNQLTGKAARAWIQNQLLISNPSDSENYAPINGVSGGAFYHGRLDDLRNYLEFAFTVNFRQTGEWIPDPKVFREPMFQIHPVVRMILMGSDPEVCRLWQNKAKQILEDDPALVKACELMQVDLDTLFSHEIPNG